MIIAGLIISGGVLAGFLILVAGIRSTDRSRSLRDPGGDGRAGSFARRVLGVYADHPVNRAHSESTADHYNQTGR